MRLWNRASTSEKSCSPPEDVSAAYPSGCRLPALAGLEAPCNYGSIATRCAAPLNQRLQLRRGLRAQSKIGGQRSAIVVRNQTVTGLVRFMIRRWGTRAILSYYGCRDPRHVSRAAPGWAKPPPEVYRGDPWRQAAGVPNLACKAQFSRSRDHAGRLPAAEHSDRL